MRSGRRINKAGGNPSVGPEGYFTDFQISTSDMLAWPSMVQKPSVATSGMVTV
jgi:hypothetical protein